MRIVEDDDEGANGEELIGARVRGQARTRPFTHDTGNRPSPDTSNALGDLTADWVRQLKALIELG
jgi:hypothetical protein